MLLIFVTALARFALNGYEVDAFDFIVKPLQYNFFSAKMNRAMKKLASEQRTKLLIKAGELHWTDGRLRTSKNDTQNHGFGILSIEKIIHKYGGRYSIQTDDHIFTMNIVFPVKDWGQTLR